MYSSARPALRAASITRRVLVKEAARACGRCGACACRIVPSASRRDRQLSSLSSPPMAVARTRGACSPSSFVAPYRDSATVGVGCASPVAARPVDRRPNHRRPHPRPPPQPAPPPLARTARRCTPWAAGPCELADHSSNPCIVTERPQRALAASLSMSLHAVGMLAGVDRHVIARGALVSSLTQSCYNPASSTPTLRPLAANPECP